jgi:hypothetical protein
MKLEKERESRMMTREQRVKEREARRILHEEELANLSEDSKKIESGAGRLSERHLKAEIEKKKQALEELAEEEDWIFDCICGAYGQIDDGTHSIACDKCNIWQHSKCVGVSQAEAERDDFHFTCTTCQRRARDEERAKTHPPIKIKLNRPGSSSSATTPKPNGTPAALANKISNGGQLGYSPQKTSPSQNQPQLASWSTTSPSKPLLQGQSQIPPKQAGPINGSQSSFQQMGHGDAAYSMQTPATGYTGPYTTSSSNGAFGSTSQQNNPRPTSSHAFSSPHQQSPTSLPPPAQPQAYTFVNGNGRYSQGSPATQGQKFTSVPDSSLHSHSLNQPANGSRPNSSDGGHRRSSIHMPSPLASAPVLTPSSKQYSGSAFAASSPTVNFSGAIQPIGSASPPDLPQQGSIALPPAASGISPIKHSPPRGDFNSTRGSPAMLPPVTSLLPSPSHQNLTPPVKSSEGEWPRPTSQGSLQ